MTVGGYHAIPGILKPGPERGGGLINEYVRVDVRGDTFAASMIGSSPNGTPAGVLDHFGTPPKPARITGVTRLPSGLRLDWTGPDGIYELQRNGIIPGGEWKEIGVTDGPAQRSFVLPLGGSSGLFRLRLVPAGASAGTAP